MALPAARGSRRRLPGVGRHDMVNSSLVPGVARTLTYRVRPQDLVTTLFPGAAEFARKPAVMATGIMVALCEWPAMDAIRQVIGDDEDTLGTGVSLSHQAPVCVGTKLIVTARCASVTGRASRWDVSVRDGMRAVATGWVEFAVVRTVAFLERHQLTLAGGPTFRGVEHRLSQEYQPTPEYAHSGRSLVAALGASPMPRM
ncbi:MAG: thioesterase family protein [Pseudonocardiaceae bacterium]